MHQPAPFLGLGFTLYGLDLCIMGIFGVGKLVGPLPLMDSRSLSSKPMQQIDTRSVFDLLNS